MHNEQKVTDSIYWIGANDFVTPRFDNLVSLPQGISYNTYFIDDEKTCVLDGIDNTCRDIFMDNLSYLLKGRALDYIIINHMEPDHSGSLLALAEAHPKAKIIASPQAIKMFEQFFHVSFKDRTILSDEKMVLDLGVHKLRFIKAPMVHWPEVTFTYDETDKVLFSADAFGTFGAIHGSIFADAVDYADAYGVEGRRYYTNTTGKYGMQVLSVLKKTAALPIDIICSLHGPVLRTEKDKAYVINRVKKWASFTPDYTSASLFFASAYGHTAMAVSRLATLLGERGVRNLKLIDLCVTPVSDAWAEVFRRSHMVLAAPTMNMCLNPAMAAFLHECTAMGIQNRKVAILGNSSWAPNVSGKLMKDIVSTWKKCEIIEAPLHVKGSITGDDEALISLADTLAADILGKEGA